MLGSKTAVLFLPSHASGVLAASTTHKRPIEIAILISKPDAQLHQIIPLSTNNGACQVINARRNLLTLIHFMKTSSMWLPIAYVPCRQLAALTRTINRRDILRAHSIYAPALDCQDYVSIGGLSEIHVSSIRCPISHSWGLVRILSATRAIIKPPFCCCPFRSGRVVYGK